MVFGLLQFISSKNNRKVQFSSGQLFFAGVLGVVVCGSLNQPLRAQDSQLSVIKTGHNSSGCPGVYLCQEGNAAPKPESAGHALEKTNFAPHPGMPGSELNKHDPVAIYREAGIDKEQERKIRKMAKDFEDLQRVRLKLVANLLREMKTLSLVVEPDEKQVMAKQDEINKAQATMANERVKLLLKIRAILNTEQKQRLVELLQGPGSTGQSAIK